MLSFLQRVEPILIDRTEVALPSRYFSRTLLSTAAVILWLITFAQLGIRPGILVLLFTLSGLFALPVLYSVRPNEHLFRSVGLGIGWTSMTALSAISGGLYSPFFPLLLGMSAFAVISREGNLSKIWLVLYIGSIVSMGILTMLSIGDTGILPPTWSVGVSSLHWTAVGLTLVWKLKQHTQRTHHLRADLKKALQHQQKLNADFDRFVYTVSNELKSPVQNILHFSSRLPAESACTKTDTIPNMIRQCAVQMHGLVENIVEFSHLSRPESKSEIVNLTWVMENLQAHFTELVGCSDCYIGHDPLPVLVTEATGIYQVFYNLVKNGLMYNENPLRRVYVHYTETETGLRFEITDNGMGISPMHRERIFEMFYRLPEAKVLPGSGIGLALCRKVTQRLGGVLSVYANENEGTTFRLELPKALLLPLERAA